MNLEPSIETSNFGEKSPTYYIVKSRAGRLKGGNWEGIGEEDFKYSLNWDRETSESLDDVLKELSEVFVYGEIYLTDREGETPFRDFFDSDEDHWGCDFWGDQVDVKVPSREKLVSDTLVELYSETAEIEEEASHQMLEALQDEIP